MKVFLIIIACIQSTVMPLDKSCVLVPTPESFETVAQCLNYVDYFKKNVESASPDMYITGFCTTKEITST